MDNIKELTREATGDGDSDDQDTIEENIAVVRDLLEGIDYFRESESNFGKIGSLLED